MLRFHGDRLDPERITDIMRMLPAKAWRKGEVYFAGPHAGYLTGRTGTCFITTDDYVGSADLERQILSKAAAWFARETNTIPRKGSSS